VLPELKAARDRSGCAALHKSEQDEATYIDMHNKAGMCTLPFGSGSGAITRRRFPHPPDLRERELLRRGASPAGSYRRVVPRVSAFYGVVIYMY
jgi:hypothetical protein